MGTLRAHVEKGRVLVDDPTDYPDGTKLQLVVVDDGDELDDEDRSRLHAALDLSEQEEREGKVVPAEQVIAWLRNRHRST